MMFGQPGNPSFGFNASAQNSPFGQSAFGKTIATTSFGTSAPPVFGSNTSLFSSKPAGSTSGNLFGNTTTTPTFGASTATQSSFGGFGGTNTNSTLFGAQQNANTNLFGTSNSTPAFGQTNKPATFGFGQATGTSLFGQPQQQVTQQTTPFGQTTASGNTGLFGTTSGFGTANNVTGISGTLVKFSPVTGTDTMVKNGVTQTISTRHHCITCMNEYESKSLEELRLEDYTAGRKGVTQGQSHTIFGTATQGSPFGNVGSNSNIANSGFGAITGGFGNANQSGNTGLFSKPIASFGVPSTTSSAFAFNSTTSSSLFNAQSKPFGATAATPLFAANNTTSTPGSAFGNINTQNTGFGTTFSSGQPNQSIGLYAQNKPAFNMPLSTSSNFAFGQSSTTNTTNLFGTKPIGTGFGTAFGGTVTSPLQGGNTGFGSVSNSNPSLFTNSFKPAGQSAGFTFGNASSIASTGLGSSGTSLFNTSTKPNLFGNAGTTTSFNTTGTFGSLQNFGSAGSTVSGLGTNLFAPGMCINNVHHNTGPVPVHQQILALVSAPFGDSPLLKNLLPASGKSEQFLKPSNTVTKALNNPHYKIITNNNATKLKPKLVTCVPLSKKSVFDGLEDEDPLLEAFQPRPNTKRLVLRPKLNTLIDQSDKSSKTDCKNNLAPVNQQTDKENKIEETNRLPSDRRSSNSWLKTSFPRKSKIIDEEFSDQLTGYSSTSELPTAAIELENTVTELRSAIRSENESNILNNLPITGIAEFNTATDKSSHDSSIYESQASETDEISNLIQLDESTNKANIKLQRYGYYTIPSLDILYKYANDKTCIVPHFTIGRKGYGNVYFPDSFDIYGLNLDEIVHFRHKEVIIYPDDNVKPPIGQGLNRKAQVTLDRVWPHDKSCHEPITDPKRLIEMDYEGKLRRVSAKHDTRFLEYRPETGSWVFKVDHFSKYGLSDSDDDEPTLEMNPDLKKIKNDYKSNDKLCGKNTTENIQYVESDVQNLDNEIISCNFMLRQSNDDSEKQSFCSPTTVHAHLVGTESHKLQLMKASFFELVHDDLVEDELDHENKKWFIGQNKQSTGNNDNDIEFQENTINCSVLQSIARPFNHSNSKSLINKKFELNRDLNNLNEEIKSKKLLVIPNVCPKVTVLKYRPGITPFNRFLKNENRFKCIADIGIQMGNIFRPSWGPQLTLISLSTQQHAAKICLYNTVDQLGSYINGRQFDDFTSTTIVQRLQILGGSNLENNYIQAFKATIEGHLDIQLQYSNIEEFQGIPIITAATGESSTFALNAHKSLSQNIASHLKSDSLIGYFCDVLCLCESLWGKLTDSHHFDNNSHEIVMLRKDAFSEWLKLVTGKIVQREMATMETNDQIIFSLLSANKLKEACNEALKVGDHCLALLLSQLSGNLATRELIKQQIKLWQNTNVDRNLTTHRLKLFMLVAGIPIICSNNETINVCENLDWKRSMAIHLWYISHPTASITDVLDLYEASFLATPTTKYTKTPRPEYFENEFKTENINGKKIYDLCYHLLKLYCTGNYSLEAILNPQTYTHDPLDYRLSWLLLQSLNALGYMHISEHVVDLIHANFATQLETFDLWHWAVFVVLHFKNPDVRYKAVIDLLLRNVKLEKTPDYIERETFLKTKLKVPLKWINHAKAIKACSMKRYGEAAWYFIHAQNWNKAHEIIMEHLATEAIINENHEYLQSLLNLLLNTNCYNSISGWAHQGQLLLDYLIITTEVTELLNNGNISDIGYKLELLQPQLTSLCTKITAFPCPTTKHRLCQAEMAKRTLQLARSLLILQSNEDNTSNFFVNLISQLPLPEDYVQQELRPFISICARNIIQ
ncbi:PREDICTED: nuclear pore complex protein Nup98-Nup96 [Ceratosolen solmsi marchali]|uniref:Nuclear pore complex protein Nup98-Nup96 n=1 Tax=Ceratosolen solmsi marchali TaxID=326594 RepID=A0AAJ6YWN0_9HYME|nr:PREDICTED: nuclear pore complex protein Nup98-Nup96 [Ceratosolen solmsi marchali]